MLETERRSNRSIQVGQMSYVPLELTSWLSVLSILTYQCSLLSVDSKLKHNILGVDEHMSCKVLEMVLFACQVGKSSFY